MHPHQPPPTTRCATQHTATPALRATHDLPRWTLLLACLTLACSPERCQSTHDTHDQGATAIASRDADRVHQPPFHEADPIPRSQLTRLDAPAFTRQTLADNARAVLRGEGMILWHATSQPPRLIVANRSYPPSLRLIDLESGAELAKFREAIDLSQAAGVLEARRADKEGKTQLGLLQLKAGRFLPIQPLFRDNTRARRPLLYTHPKSQDIWMFARQGKDIKGWFTRSKPDHKGPSRLDRAISFMPNYIRYNEGLRAIEVERKLRARSPKDYEALARARSRRLERLPLEQRPCGRVRIAHDETTSCVSPELEREVSDDAIFLDGPWVSYDADLSGHKPRLGVPTLVDTQHKQAEALFQNPRDCRALFRTGLPRPPRLLYGCANHDHSAIRFRLWSPEARYQWSGDRQWVEKIWSIEDGFAVMRDWPTRAEGPILPIAATKAPASVWLDLENANLIEGPSLQMLCAKNACPHHALAFERSKDDKHIKLWAIDFADQTMRLAEPELDCDGVLENLAQQGDRVWLRCQQAPRPGQRPQVRWHELVDLEHHTRYRLKHQPQQLLEDGSLIASPPDEDPGRGVSVLFHLDPASAQPSIDREKF